jgi:hypothetical protein
MKEGGSVTQGKLYGRRAIRALLAVTLVTVAVPISYAVAASKSSTATVNFEQYDNSCSYLPKRKIVGTAQLAEKNGTLTGNLNVTGAMPSNSFYIWVYADTYQGSPLVNCPTYWEAGKLKVDASGDGSRSFKITGVSGYTDFWIYAYDYQNDIAYRSQSAHI